MGPAFLRKAVQLLGTLEAWYVVPFDDLPMSTDLPIEAPQKELRSIISGRMRSDWNISYNAPAWSLKTTALVSTCSSPSSLRISDW